jgi:hypothetical protein
MFRTYFLLPLLIPLAFMKGNFAEALFYRLEQLIKWVVVKPVRAMALVGAVSLLVSAGITLGTHIPVPQVQDEFSYLLMGDTFAHGRVTNPPPPLWEHFETIHEIMQPTYTAKYPPGQGLALAVGELLGSPIIGVWLTTALACMAMYWMLMAWMPSCWALVGGVLTAFHPQVIEWSQNYWGGAVAMGGGALVIGGFRRLLNNEPRVRNAAVMGLGIVILANSRPYEGMVFSLLVGLALLIWTLKSRKVGVAPFFRRVVVPLAVMMALLACEEGYYNWRVTGNPLVMPYMVHIKTYGIDPVFIFSVPRTEPVFRHREIQNLQETYLRYYLKQRSSWRSLLKATEEKFEDLLHSYLWSMLLLVPLMGLPGALWRDRALRLVFVIGVFFLAALLMETWVHAHYAAPAAAVFFLLVLASMRMLNAWHCEGRRGGRNVLRGLAILLAISFVSTVVKMAEADPSRWFFKRAALLDALKREPERSLVIVKYDPDHNPHREWVYNEADLVNAKVILARDMGEKNKELLDYFRDRKAWVVHADAATPKLELYPGS